MLFSKPEYKEIYLPFRFVEDNEDKDAGLMSIEAYGNISGEMKYCYITYGFRTKYFKMLDSGDYEQMVDKLRNSIGTNIKVTLIIKKKSIDFKIPPENISEALEDERFNRLECVGRGLNDRPFEEIEAKFQEGI